MSPYRSPSALPRVPLPSQWCAHPDCGRPVITYKTWYALTRKQRHQLRNLGRRPLRGRGLCEPCYQRVTRDGTRIDHERRTMPAEELMGEWRHLDHDRTRSRAARFRAAAPRFNMTEAALARALSRQRCARRSSTPTGRAADLSARAGKV